MRAAEVNRSESEIGDFPCVDGVYDDEDSRIPNEETVIEILTEICRDLCRRCFCEDRDFLLDFYPRRSL